MAEMLGSISESDDAFANIPAPFVRMQSKVHTNFKTKNRSLNKPIDCLLGTDSETGTKIHLGKKVTCTAELHAKKKQIDTISSFTIDIDDLAVSEEAGADKNCYSPVIIDTGESDEIDLSNIESTPVDDYPASSLQNGTVSQGDITKLNVDIQPTVFTAVPSGDELIPLGSGVITELLGEGGMAKVYKIWNAAIEMFRAVKLLLPSTSTSHLQRFFTEAKISAKLKHPNIIQVHETGEWNGLPYIEMEYLEGVTLQTFLQYFHSLPPKLCSAIAVQIARALAYAHNEQITLYGKSYSGIIHRDLKPSNIMIGFDGRVKLMDFGVARPIETGLHTANIDSVVGTLQYFSPEQVNGYPTDLLSDIYSFGAVLYEMLCGLNPFPQTNLAELVRAKTINKYIRLHEYLLTIEPHLASLAQICLRTEKSTRIQNSILLRDYLEDLHYTLGADTPENVIRSFFNSTETSYRKE